MPDWLIALVLSIVEGLTEFIPVSSTGHLILVGHLLGFVDERAATFEVFIQLGAILAVVVLYRKRFIGLLDFERQTGFRGVRGLSLLAISVIPALVGGALAYDFIKGSLFQPWTVAVGLAAGAIAILVVEAWKPAPRVHDLDAITWRIALVVGLSQLFALWPGVSRSAATILGGMLGGVRRETAAEYSFLLGVPVIAAAALYDLWQNLDLLTAADIPLFALGFVASFLAAWLAVRFFLRLLSMVTLRPFAWYRLLLAAVVLLVLSV